MGILTLQGGEDVNTEATPDSSCSDHCACRGNPADYSIETDSGCMAYQTTVGWSLLSSGIVTLLLNVLPGDSLWWGIGLLLAGLIVLYIRRDDVSEAIEAAS